jgi:Amt family ammonium transporter
MMMSFASLGVVAVAWAVVGYSLAFGDGSGGASWAAPWVGGLDHVGLAGVGLEARGSIPHLLFALYQGTFAIIAAALISGAVVERMRFGPYLAFLGLWTVLVYAPVCHWVWGGGWLARLDALDFAGGTVVHVNAGAAAVVAALVLGPRRDYARQALLPHNVPFTLLGAGLLWFGWIGFNAGSALAANGAAALALTNTILAPSAALLAWMLQESRRGGKPTAVGAATGVVVGLVAVTPAAGFIGPMAALALGAVAAVPSYFVILRRHRSRLDDSLDVAAAHGVGGLAGALLTGVLARAVWGGKDGLLAGEPRQLLVQAAAVAACLAYSGAVSWLILKGLAALGPLRVAEREEGVGLDVSLHGEEAYGTGEGAILVLPPSGEMKRRPAGAPAPRPAPAATGVEG